MRDGETGLLSLRFPANAAHALLLAPFQGRGRSPGAGATACQLQPALVSALLSVWPLLLGAKGPRSSLTSITLSKQRRPSC